MSRLSVQTNHLARILLAAASGAAAAKHLGALINVTLTRKALHPHNVQIPSKHALDLVTERTRGSPFCKCTSFGSGCSSSPPSSLMIGGAFRWSCLAVKVRRQSPGHFLTAAVAAAAPRPLTTDGQATTLATSSPRPRHQGGKPPPTKATAAER